MASTEDNPYTSPQLPPADGDSQAARPAHYMSPAPVEGGEGDHPFSPTRGLTFRMYAGLATGLAAVYVAIAALYPTLGAVIGAVLLVAGFGLLTTKVVLRIENPRKMWCLTPVCGVGCLLILWLLFRLASLLS
jgi:hypothetical protein